MEVVGCGSVQVDMPDEIVPYYDHFFQIVPESHKSSGTITIDPGSSFAPGVNGYCSHPFVGNWSIHLNQDRWNVSGDDLRKVLVFHELTHCIFSSPVHSSDPTSYMYMYLVHPSWDFDTRVANYIKNL